MASQMLTEEEAMLQGEANMWHFTYSAVESMALKCAVELRIADIIYSHGTPITLSQIAADINSSTLDVSGLARLLRFLVHKKVFDELPHSDTETAYSLNHSSKWLLHNAKLSVSPLVLMFTHSVIQAPFQLLSQSILEGGTAFQKAHGQELWQYNSVNPNFSRIFNEGMACTGRITTNAIVRIYGGFGGIKTLVDVGGGVGAAISEIVKANAHIKGINFDLPHVVATAPAYDGVIHVGGDMFEAVPQADAMFIKELVPNSCILESDFQTAAEAGKNFCLRTLPYIAGLYSNCDVQWIMHNWGDEDCVKILKNCRKAIPEKGGKIIIVDVVLHPGGDGPFDDSGHVFDLVMLTHFSGGRERTEVEWKKLLEEAGFPFYKIVKIPALLSIIEAYP